MEPYPGFSFLDQQPFALSVVQRTAQVYGRRAVAALPEEILILRYLDYFGGRATVLELGTALGFTLTDDFALPTPRYRDEAEAAVWQELLAQLAKFGLVQLHQNQVRRTRYAAVLLETNVKYEYFTADCRFWQFAELIAPADFPFHELGKRATLTNSSVVSHPGRAENAPAAAPGNQLPDTTSDDDKHQSSQIATQLAAADEWAAVEILPRAPKLLNQYPFQDKVEAVGHCYRLTTAPAKQDAPDYRITAAVGDSASAALTATLNAPENVALRLRWGHACEYHHFRADPAAIIDLTALRRFAHDWPYGELLPDARLTWAEPGVLDQFQHYATTHLPAGTYRDYCAQLSAHIPLPLLQAALDSYPSLWAWPQLSARLAEPFISAHLVQALDHAPELRYPWDFEVLSQRPAPAIEGWLTQLLHSPWAKHLADADTFDWDWAALTLRLSTPFVLAHLAALPFSHSLLPERGPAFLQAALLAEIAAGKIGDWRWDTVQDQLGLQFVWDNLAALQMHVRWPQLLGQLLAPNAPRPVGFDLPQLLELVRTNRERIQPFSNEMLDWTPDLIQFFDDQQLLHWSSNAYSAGFEVHPAVPWSAAHLARYHHRVHTPTGRAYVSAHLPDLALVAQYPNFEWDWAELSGNPHFAWTRVLTTAYRDRLVWSRLLQRFGPDEVTRRLPGLHQQLATSQPASLPDLWHYANAHVAVPTLLAWRSDYADFIDLGQLCHRDAPAVAAYLLATPDFNQPWDWAALATALPPETLINLLRKLERWFRQTGDERPAAFSRLVAPRLPLDFSLRTAPVLTLPWDWEYVSHQLTPAQLGPYLPTLAPKLDWTYLVQQLAMQPPLVAEWMLDPSAQAFLPWPAVSCLLTPEQVAAHLDALAAYLDWEYLARQPAMHPLIVSQLLDHPVAGPRLPWPFVLRHCFSPEEIGANLGEWTTRLNALDPPEVRAAAWQAFTRLVPVEAILAAPGQTLYRAVPPAELRTMQLNWEFLSADNRSHLFALDFLRRYRDFWHWPTLSRNLLLNANDNYLLDPNLRTRWDWEWLSEYSTFSLPDKKFVTLKNKLEKIGDFIHWPALSRRTDLPLSGILLEYFASKEWDWEALSCSSKLALTPTTALNLRSKPWNWAALSANTGLNLDLSTLVQLADYPWDWPALSANRSLQLHEAPTLLGLCQCAHGLAAHPWHWPTLTRRPDLPWRADLLRQLAPHDLDWPFICSKLPAGRIEWSQDLLLDLRDRLDWSGLSQRPPLPLTPELLQVLAAYWDFEALSWCAALTQPATPAAPAAEAPNPALLLVTTADLPWNWYTISTRTDIKFSQEILDPLVDRLHWPSLSSRQWGPAFEQGWVARYRPHWNLVALAIPARLPASAHAEVLAAIDADPTRVLPYIYSLQRQSSSWAGYAFHCTHITNAAAIIKSGKLLSRREVKKTPHKLADASGSINARDSPVWDFARLYYRPLTFTQFYTERLGLDHTSTSDPELYGRAESLGFPKCPIPVFFRFRLDEILQKSAERFYISDGNMQRAETTHGPLRSMQRRFNPDPLLYHRKATGPFLNPSDWKLHKDISQQEILLRPGLELAAVDTIDIFVQDDWAGDELRHLIGSDHPLVNCIQVDYGECFHSDNKPVHCEYIDNKLTVKTNFSDDHELVFECDDLSKIAEIQLPNSEYRTVGRQIISQHHLQLTLHEPIAFTVSFRDKVFSRPGGPREYELFRSAPMLATLLNNVVGVDSTDGDALDSVPTGTLPLVSMGSAVI